MVGLVRSVIVAEAPFLLDMMRENFTPSGLSIPVRT